MKPQNQENKSNKRTNHWHWIPKNKGETKTDYKCLKCRQQFNCSSFKSFEKEK